MVRILGSHIRVSTVKKKQNGGIETLYIHVTLDLVFTFFSVHNRVFEIFLDD